MPLSVPTEDHATHAPVHAHLDKVKFVVHEGEQFKDDNEARTAAHAWCALPGNSGWIYKGKHQVRDDKSEFEVHIATVTLCNDKHPDAIAATEVVEELKVEEDPDVKVEALGAEGDCSGNVEHIDVAKEDTAED